MRPPAAARGAAAMSAPHERPHPMDTARPSVSALWRDLTVPTVGDRAGRRPLPVLW